MNVCLIPAKGKSTRIPRKNIREFHGRPIIGYSIDTAFASRLFTHVIVSTEDEEISEIAQKCGADVLMRPEKWTRDEFGPVDVARHSLSLIADCSMVCVLYATAPLLRVADLVRGWREVSREGVSFAISVGTYPFLHDAAQFIWAKSWALTDRVGEFSETTVMVPIARERDCDINTLEDWSRAEEMYAALRYKEAA